MLLQPVKCEQEPSAKLHSVAVGEFYVTLWQPFINSSFSIKFMGGGSLLKTVSCSRNVPTDSLLRSGQLVLRQK